ncbi:hypothetical protein N665_0399s0029 [Sinapis alba]|nr:hypothetical protein N665_0399s0029 [Sinapis alba]
MCLFLVVLQHVVEACRVVTIFKDFICFFFGPTARSSDQASLCWDCDIKIHGANFLVAKHTRCLLCSVCQSPTPWKAFGIRFGPTGSICEFCLAGTNNSVTGSSEEEAKNQVVPWDAAPVMSSSFFVSSERKVSQAMEGILILTAPMAVIRHRHHHRLLWF